MESLRMRRRLLVVVNEALMHNHQWELAGALRDAGYLECATPPICDMIAAFERIEKTGDALAPYTDAGAHALKAVVDEERRKAEAALARSPHRTTLLAASCGILVAAAACGLRLGAFS